MSQIIAVPTTGVHLNDWKAVKWTVNEDGEPVAENPDHQQQIEEYLECERSPVLLRLWVERYGGEWKPEQFRLSGEAV